MDLKRRRLAIITTGVIIVVAFVLWRNRWHLGRTAVTIADPMIRAWVTRRGLEASDSVYHITASTIKVDEGHRRITIDTITVTTDAEANARLPRPHAAMTVRFSHCGVRGIDLGMLTGGQGLHALHAGCDSVSAMEQTLAPPRETGVAPRAGADSNNFLRFQGKIDLPSMLPYVAVDTVAFPHVHVAFDLLGADGKRSALVVDSIGVELDSLRIDPREPVAKRRPLFSQDITVRLDRFEGSTSHAAHLALKHLRANLALGTCQLDSLVYEPLPGTRADSLGFAEFRAGHLALSGVDWRGFLLAGSVGIGQMTLDSVLLRVAAPKHVPPILPREAPPAHLEATLRAAGRLVRLDSLTVMGLTLVEMPTLRTDSVVTRIKRLTVAHFRFGTDEQSWNSDFPIGPVTLTIEGMLRRTRKLDITVAHGTIDAARRSITVDAIQAAPPGNDSTFQLRSPYRKSRLSIRMQHAEARRLDLPAFLRRGALRSQALDARGLVIDILNDKRKSRPPVAKVRRFPQQVLRELGTEFQIDTVLASGLLSYRERDSTAATTGTLTFGALQVRGYNFSTVAGAGPFRLGGDAKLMGAGPMHVEWVVPLLSRDFAMRWHGVLGTMDLKAMNSFLPDAVGMKFAGGVLEGAQWDVVVSNGLAKGKLTPRWRGLSVSLPGVARSDAGLLGGIARGVAKLAANAFGIRSDNDTAGGHRPLDASVTHQWRKTETLPQFIWLQLRDPLMLILKK